MPVSLQWCLFITHLCLFICVVKHTPVLPLPCCNFWLPGKGPVTRSRQLTPHSALTMPRITVSCTVSYTVREKNTIPSCSMLQLRGTLQARPGLVAFARPDSTTLLTSSSNTLLAHKQHRRHLWSHPSKYLVKGVFQPL